MSSTSPASTYSQTVLKNNPSFFWPLNDTGSTAADASPNGFNGSYSGGTTQGVPGPLTGSTATSFGGSTGNVVSQNAVTGPQTFTVEGWFKTTTNTGGKIIGFGGSPSGLSGNYDRHIYMMNDGQLVRVLRAEFGREIDSYAVTQGRPLLAAEMEREMLKRL